VFQINQLAITLGISLTAFLILYFTFLWDPKEHIFLRILGSFFFVVILLLVPKVSLDYSKACDFVVNETNEIFVYGNNYSGYHWDYESPSPSVNDVNLFHKQTINTYDYVCDDTENGTSIIFYKAYWWFLRVFFAYIFVYYIYIVFVKNNEKLMKVFKRGKK
jgi:hypothetical protein